MKRYVAILISAVLMLMFAVNLAAQPRPGADRIKKMAERHLGLGPLIHNPEFRTKLGISDEQYNKLQTGFMNSAKTAIKNRADLQIKRLELANLMNADKPDRAQINQKINEISALQTAQMKNHVDTRLLVKETLTSDQLNKYQQWRQEQTRRFLEQRQPRGGMMRGGRPGMEPRGPTPPPPPKPEGGVQ